MKIILNETPKPTLEQFADSMGFDIEVNERDNPVLVNTRYGNSWPANPLNSQS